MNKIMLLQKSCLGEMTVKVKSMPSGSKGQVNAKDKSISRSNKDKSQVNAKVK